MKRIFDAYGHFNNRVAVWVTASVGSMTCAWLFGVWAICGIPAALQPGGIGIVNWFAEEFLQLVLLSIIIVGQNIQAAASERRNQETHDAVMEELADMREIMRVIHEREAGNGS